MTPIARNNIVVASTLVVVVTVLATPRYLDMVVACGVGFRSDDMATDYLKGVLWAIFIGLGILLWPVPMRDKKALLYGWLAKVIVTLGVMLLYEQRYELDAGMYFDHSHTGDFSIAGFDLTNGTISLINLARLHRQLCPDSYHAMKVSFAMLGLLGIYLFYRSACLFLGREDRRFLYLLSLFPGILFWSSILGKDPVAFLGIAMYSYGLVGWHRCRNILYLPVLVLGILMTTLIRPWLSIIMILPLVVLVLSGMRGASRLLCCGLVIILLIICTKPMVAKFKIASMSDLLYTADQTTKGFVKTAGGSTQQMDVDLTTAGGITTFLPVAAFTAVFRPLPGEVMNPFGLLAGLESSVLLYLLVRALKRTSSKELREPLVLWAISFVTIWALINGIVSSINFGVGVRYKLQILPVLLGLLLYLSRDRQEISVAAAVSSPALDGACVSSSPHLLHPENK